MAFFRKIFNPTKSFNHDTELKDKKPEGHFIEGFTVMAAPSGWQTLGESIIFPKVLMGLQNNRDLCFYTTEGEFKEAKRVMTIPPGTQLLKIDLALRIEDPAKIPERLSIKPGMVTNLNQIHYLTFSYSEDKPTLIWNSKYNPIRQFIESPKRPSSPK